MKNRQLLRYVAISIGLALTLAPAFANTSPGDQVDLSFEPRAEREDSTALAMPFFPSLRMVFNQYHIRLALVLPRLSISRDARDATGRYIFSPRRHDSTIRNIDRRRADPRYKPLVRSWR
jgi:hypothetical protein